MRSFQALFSKKGQAASVFIVILICTLFLLVLNTSRISPQLFFFSILAAIFFVIAFLRTDFALYLLIITMFFSPPLRMGELSDRAVLLRMDDIFIVVMFIAWLAKLAVFKELGLLKRTVLNAPIYLYILVCIISTSLKLIGGNASIARSFFYFLKYFEYFLLYFLVVNNIENLKQVKAFIFLMIFTCFFVSIYGLYSYFALGMRASAPFEGSLGEANTLAGYLVLMMGIMLGLLLYSRSQGLKLWLSAVLVMSFGTLVYTMSRSGWLSFVVMYLAFIYFSRKAKPLLVLGLVCMMALAPLLAPEAVKERFEESFAGGRTYKLGAQQVTLDESGTARVEAWDMGFKKLVKKPFLGFGIPGASVIDNQYVRVMIEVGLLGLAAFMFLLFRIFKVSHYVLTVSRDDGFIEGLCVGFLAGFFGLLVHCLSAATFILVRIMEPFWFIMAMIIVLPHICPKVPEREVEWSTT